MAEEIKQEQKRPSRGGGGSARRGSGGGRGRDSGGSRGRGGARREEETREYDQKVLDLARVTRVTAGGKRMRFRAAVVIGDRKGAIGFGLAKGADVSLAVDKATRQAKRGILRVSLESGTVPHPVKFKFGATTVLLKPAPKGTGLKAGGAVRVMLELGGIPNAVSKIFGSSNKINVAKATMGALADLRPSKKP